MSARGRSTVAARALSLRARLRRWLARGYTMIEVMMALGVLAVGAVGVIAIQKVAVVGNASARSISTGTAIAERWIERLRADAMLWNSAQPPDLGETRWLKTVLTQPDAWTAPDAFPGETSAKADPLGADLVNPADPAVVAYCTTIRYRQITPRLITVTVRVVWRRDFSVISCELPLFADETVDISPLGYGAVYLTSGVLMQERP